MHRIESGSLDVFYGWSWITHSFLLISFSLLIWYFFFFLSALMFLCQCSNSILFRSICVFESRRLGTECTGCERAKNSHSVSKLAFSATRKGRDSARPECTEKFCVTVQECSCAQTVDKEIREAGERDCFKLPTARALNQTAINVS